MRNLILVLLCIFWGGVDPIADNSTSQLGLDYLALVDSAKNKIHAQDYSGAIEELNLVIDTQKSVLGKILRMRGDSYFATGEYKKAEVDYRDVLVLTGSRNGVLEYIIGKCLLAQAKHQEAYSFFDLALKNLPMEKTVGDEKLRHARFMYKYHLAEAVLYIGRKQEAVEMFHSIHREFPEEDMDEVLSNLERFTSKRSQK